MEGMNFKKTNKLKNVDTLGNMVIGVSAKTDSIDTNFTFLDTINSISDVFNNSKNVILKEGIYNTDSSVEVRDGIYVRSNRESTIKSNGKTLKILSKSNVVIENIIFDGFFAIEVKDSVNIKFVNCKFNNFIHNGIVTERNDILEFIDCSWDMIGSPTTNPTWQGNGIYAKDDNKLRVLDCSFTNIYGHGGIFLINCSNLEIRRFKCKDVAWRAINFWSGVHSGIMEDLEIENTGTINETSDAIGCNGIFSATGDVQHVTLRRAKFKHIYENAIEAGFGIMEDIYIDGTGVSLDTHPTPSTEGIWLEPTDYPRVLRNVYMKNIHNAGIKYSTGEAGSVLKNISIENITMENSITDRHAIHLNYTRFENVKISNITSHNTSPLWLRSGAGYVDCNISSINNISKHPTMQSPFSGKIKFSGLPLLGLLKNNDFSNWTSDTVLQDWSLSSFVASKSPSEYYDDVSLTTTSGGFNGSIGQDIKISKDMKFYQLEFTFKSEHKARILITPYEKGTNTLQYGKMKEFISSGNDSVNFITENFVTDLPVGRYRVSFGINTNVQGTNVVYRNIKDNVFF